LLQGHVSVQGDKTCPKPVRATFYQVPFSTSPLLSDIHSPEIPQEYLHKPYISRNRVPRYISVANSMGLSSSNSTWWTPKNTCIMQ